MSHSYPKTVSTSFLALLLIAGLAACGDDPAPVTQPTTAAVAPAASEAGGEPDRAGSTSNTPPEISGIRFEPEEPVAGESVRAVVDTDDADGDSVWLDYAWRVDGEPVEGDMPRLLLRGVRKGQSVEVTVTPRDGVDTGETRRHFTDVGNAPPKLGRVRVEPSNDVVAGTPIVVRPEASDPDGDAMTFRFQWTVNDIAVREEGPQLETDRLNRGDRVQVTVTAGDGRDESDPVKVPELLVVNAPPRIVEVSSEPQRSGELFYRVRAEDPDGDLQLQFSLDDPPDGMSIDARNGEIHWVPTPDQVGTHSVAVIVDDLHGGRSRQSIEVIVSAPDVGAQPPARAR